MDKANPPTVHGAFKPVGHTVMAFQSAADLQAAVDALIADGFTPDELTRSAP